MKKDIQMKCLIVGDIHQKIDLVEKHIAGWTDKIIFIGDYFDNFNDTPEQAREMADWLKDSLKKENRIHLMGNHDYYYRVPMGKSGICSGFTSQKYEIINSILDFSDWNLIKYFYHEKYEDLDYWFSHAGISSHWFRHPVLGISTEIVDKKVQEAQNDIEAQNYESNFAKRINAVDWYRGGRHPRGGLLWNHWPTAELHKGVVQVLGHTTVPKIKIKTKFESKTINVDTALKQSLIIDNGNLIIKNL
jgi:predicted MPP superfamily phosphohydrolase